MCERKSFDIIPHHQWPLNLKFGLEHLFTECSICLMSSEEIKTCVMFAICGHRFCLECAQKLMHVGFENKTDTMCPLCRSPLNDISDENKRIILQMDKDEIWWFPSDEELNLTLRMAIDNLCHKLFGSINRLSTAHVSFQEHRSGLKNLNIHAQDVKLPVGSKLKVMRSHSHIRGIPVTERNHKTILKSFIVAILYSNGRVESKKILDFILKHFPHYSPVDVQKVTMDLMRRRYCKWYCKGILEYEV